MQLLISMKIPTSVLVLAPPPSQTAPGVPVSPAPPGKSRPIPVSPSPPVRSLPCPQSPPHPGRARPAPHGRSDLSRAPPPLLPSTKMAAPLPLSSARPARPPSPCSYLSELPPIRKSCVFIGLYSEGGGAPLRLAMIGHRGGVGGTKRAQRCDWLHGAGAGQNAIARWRLVRPSGRGEAERRGKMAALWRSLRALRALPGGARSRSAGPPGAVTLPRPLGADAHEEEPMLVAQRKVSGQGHGGRGGACVGIVVGVVWGGACLGWDSCP